MKRCLLLLFGFCIAFNCFLSQAADDLHDAFINPPQQALPRGYWLWPHSNFDYATIEAELAEFKRMGLGGVDIFDLGVRDRNDAIPPGIGFMSAEQIDGIAYALEEAKRLGLDMGLIVSSSWNAGASWTRPEHAQMNLVAWSEVVEGPVTYEKQLPFPEIPDSFSKPYGDYELHVPKDENGLPVFRQTVAVLAFPLKGESLIPSLDAVRRLEAQVSDDGVLTCELPEGRWAIMRVECVNHGQMLWLPSDGSEGLIMDHFSKEATQAHFQTLVDRLTARVGPLEDTALERFYLCSYESAAEVIWTPTLPEEFHARNGYAIEPFIPALFGYEVIDDDTTRRFLYDYRLTVSDIFVENLYEEASRICRENGLLLCSESGGPGPPLHNVPTEDLKALGAVDIMRGEFWNRGTPWEDEDGFELLQVVKGIASAAHIYGHDIVEMEAFTSHIHWQEGPSLFKPLADRAFCEGMNRVVYHTMSHHLPEAGTPGWTYQAGTHMSTNLTWWPMSEHLHAYLARCSALLQSGRFVADACYYYGHDIPNFAKPKHIRPDLGPGYDYDDLNTEVLLTASVRDGKVILPGGMEYHVLVLPESPRMSLDALKAIESLIKQGAVAIGPKPETTYGLAGYPESEAELKRIADRLWGPDSADSVDQQYGKGRIVNGKTTREVLQSISISPDLRVIGVPYEHIDYIHRTTGEEEIYFIRNQTESPISFDARFRIDHAAPELWNPVSAKRTRIALYEKESEGIRLPLRLEAHGSIFVIFDREAVSGEHAKSLWHNGTRLFPLDEMQTRDSELNYRVWTEDGTMRLAASKAGEYTLMMNDGSRLAMTIQKPESLPVRGPWDLRFPHGWGAPQRTILDHLRSWTDFSDEGVRAFSGIAAYRKTIDINLEHFNEFERIELDLGDVREIARVYLNGNELGVSSFAPHRFDVTDVVRNGANHLVVYVANTWLNRLIADDRLPVEQRLTHSNLERGPNGRAPWSGAAPLPSGLLGPVALKGFDEIIFD